MLRQSLFLATYDAFNIFNDIGTILLLRETFERHFGSGNILGRVLNILGTRSLRLKQRLCLCTLAILIALELTTHTANLQT